MLIIILAIFLRVFYFTGIVLTDTQDDSIYLNAIKNYMDGKMDLGRYKTLLQEEYINPIDIFPLRFGLILPTLFFMKLLGINEFSATFFTLLCSIGLVILVYLIGKILFNKKTALVCSAVYAVFPLDIIYSTRLLPDIPLSFFIALAIYLYLKSNSFDNKKKVNKIMFLSGLSLGMAYLIRSQLLVLIPLILFIYILYEKKIKLKHVFSLAGFLTLILLSSIYLYAHTGDLLTDFKVNKKAYDSKYGQEYIGRYNEYSIDSIINFLYLPDSAFYFTKLMFFHKLHRPRVDYLAYFYMILPIAILWALFVIIKIKDKNKLMLLVWFLFAFFLIELGPMYLSFFSGDTAITYGLVDKNQKHLILASVPAVMLIGLLLTDLLNHKYLRILGILLFIFLFINSIYSINKSTAYLREGINDIKVAAKFLKQAESKPIYADNLAIGELKFYLGWDEDYEFRDIGLVYGIYSIEDAYIILGGSRGYDISASYINTISKYNDMSFYNNFTILKEIEGPTNLGRTNNMFILYAPP